MVVYEPVEKIVYKPAEEPVIKEIEVQRSLLQFESLAELKQWLSNVKLIDIHFTVVNEIGNSVQKFDCDDYARRLQDWALQEGYIISFEVIRHTEYNSLFTQKRLPVGDIHAINSVIIGNSVYYIEPQTQEIIFVANLD